MIPLGILLIGAIAALWAAIKGAPEIEEQHDDSARDIAAPERKGDAR